MKKKFWTNLFFGYFIFCMIGMFFGLMNTIEERSSVAWNLKEPKTGCSYKSLISVSNLGYVFVCELGRQRFDIPKDN